MFQQVRGQKKDHRVKKVSAKVDKQEVEIHQRMTVASLAKAMNRDTGEQARRRRDAAAVSTVCFVSFRSRL